MENDYLTKDNIKDLVESNKSGFYSTSCIYAEKYSIKFTNKNEPSTGSPNLVINKRC